MSGYTVRKVHPQTSSKSLFLDFMASFQLSSEECPICHSTGNCKNHVSYSRSIIDIINGKPFYQNICINRIICESCGHTHAILPDTIIPYSQYGIFFILRVLGGYFAHVKTAYYKRVTEKPLKLPDGTIKEYNYKTV